MGRACLLGTAQPLRPRNHIGFCLSNVLSILIFILCLFFQHNNSRNPVPQSCDIIDRHTVLFIGETGNYLKHVVCAASNQVCMIAVLDLNQYIVASTHPFGREKA